MSYVLGFGSGFNWVSYVDPDLESGSRQAKIVPQKEKHEEILSKDLLLGWRLLLEPERPLKGLKKTDKMTILKKI
jgi:hypothetical protein